jgi:hypothetical protein
VLTIGVLGTWLQLAGTSSFALGSTLHRRAFVAVTGQTTSFLPGDDGSVQAGVPFPKPRFIDKGDGTVKDKLTKLIWLKNANCFDEQEWNAALEAVNGLADGACGLTDHSKAGDWRLPNVRELESLLDFAFFHPALSNAAGTAQWTEGDAFSNVQSASYWSSTTRGQGPNLAFLVNLDGTGTGSSLKSLGLFAWPVRGARGTGAA